MSPTKQEVALTMNISGLLTHEYIPNLKVSAILSRARMIQYHSFSETSAILPSWHLISECLVKNYTVIIHLNIKIIYHSWPWKLEDTPSFLKKVNTISQIYFDLLSVKKCFSRISFFTCNMHIYYQSKKRCSCVCVKYIRVRNIMSHLNLKYSWFLYSQ